MSHIAKRFGWVSVYAVAMALLEAAVVAYIRALIHVTADQVDLGPFLTIEIGREVATIVMLVAVGWLAGTRGLERWTYGLYAFGLWDIFYYVWLKVLLDWPRTLLDWDILFLIPLRLWGPVLAPVLIAALICVTAVLAVVQLERGVRLGITPQRVAAVVLGALLALYVFVADAMHTLLAGQPGWDTLRPSPFRWPLFLLALALMAWPGLAMVWRWPAGTGQKAIARPPTPGPVAEKGTNRQGVSHESQDDPARAHGGQESVLAPDQVLTFPTARAGHAGRLPRTRRRGRDPG